MAGLPSVSNPVTTRLASMINAFLWSLLLISSQGKPATIDGKGVAGDILGRRRSQKDNGGADVFRETEAAHGHSVRPRLHPVRCIVVPSRPAVGCLGAHGVGEPI